MVSQTGSLNPASLCGLAWFRLCLPGALFVGSVSCASAVTPLPFLGCCAVLIMLGQSLPLHWKGIINIPYHSDLNERRLIGGTKLHSGRGLQSSLSMLCVFACVSLCSSRLSPHRFTSTLTASGVL